MLKVRSYLHFLLLLSVLALLTCNTLPTDPLKDPNNLKVGLINANYILQNDSVKVGITVNVPSLVKSLRVIHDEDSKESFLPLNRPSSENPDTMYFIKPQEIKQ
jgi:hypothetical protein